MTITLCAQPYDIAAQGFCFDSLEDYQTKSQNARNDYGEPVEEFEIQFIDGAAIDAELANAMGLNQANLARFFEGVEAWDDYGKLMAIIALREGAGFDPASDNPYDFDIAMYFVDSLEQLAAMFVDERVFGEIPEPLQFYIDHDAIARDLAVDYTLVSVAEYRVAYRLG